MASFLGLDYVTPLTINSRGRVFRSETLNLKVQSNQNGTQRWDMNVTLAPTTSDDPLASAARLSVHRSINGTHTGFTMTMPQHTGVEDRLVDGTIEVAGPRAAGLSTVLVDKPVGTSIDGLIPQGYYIKFSNHTKIYQVTADLTVPSDSTIVELDIFPPLVDALAANDTLDFEPEISVLYAPDGVEGISYTDGIVTQATISVVENLA